MKRIYILGYIAIVETFRSLRIASNQIHYEFLAILTNRLDDVEATHLWPLKFAPGRHSRGHRPEPLTGDVAVRPVEFDTEETAACELRRE
jgi:hypothetical protein